MIRAVRRGQDAALTFVAAPATRWRMYRDATKLALGTTSLSPDALVTSFDDVGVVPPPPDLLFYRVKGYRRARSRRGRDHASFAPYEVKGRVTDRAVVLPSLSPSTD